MLKASSTIREYVDDFISLLLPTTCHHCHQTLRKNEHHICTLCQMDLPTTNYHLSYNDNPLFNDLKIIENVTFAAAYLHYQKFGLAQTLLHQLKYCGNYELGVQLGLWYGSHLENKVLGDILIPVPIHPKKLKTRGYNQSQAIAEGLQQRLRIPLGVDHVSRVRNTSTQTRKKKIGRWMELQGAFNVKQPERIQSRRIVVVDDVVTTGSTIYALCEQLNLFKPKSIQVLAIATGK